jgi:hypothetical protein
MNNIHKEASNQMGHLYLMSGSPQIPSTAHMRIMQAQSSTAPTKVVLPKKTVNFQILESFYQGKTQFPSITSLTLKTCIHQIHMIPVCTKAIRDMYASDMLKHNLKTLTLLYIQCRFLLFLFSELVFDTDWSWYIWSSRMYLSP